MNKTKSKKSVFVTLAILGLLASATLVAAYPALKSSGIMGPENREALIKAVENNDYEEWKLLMSEHLTEERFNEIAEKHNLMQQRRVAIEDAIESEDYDAWVSAVSANGKGKVSQFITEDNFPTLVKLHEAREAGDIEQVKLLSEELGLPQRFHDAKVYQAGFKHGKQVANHRY